MADTIQARATAACVLIAHAGNPITHKLAAGFLLGLADLSRAIQGLAHTTAMRRLELSARAFRIVATDRVALRNLNP